MKKIFAVIILIICFVGVSILYCANYAFNVILGKKPNLNTNRWEIVDLFVDASSYAIDLIIK